MFGSEKDGTWRVLRTSAFSAYIQGMLFLDLVDSPWPDEHGVHYLDIALFISNTLWLCSF